jgi:hypothetical protein
MTGRGQQLLQWWQIILDVGWGHSCRQLQRPSICEMYQHSVHVILWLSVLKKPRGTQHSTHTMMHSFLLYVKANLKYGSSQSETTNCFMLYSIPCAQLSLNQECSLPLISLLEVCYLLYQSHSIIDWHANTTYYVNDTGSQFYSPPGWG